MDSNEADEPREIGRVIRDSGPPAILTSDGLWHCDDKDVEWQVRFFCHPDVAGDLPEFPFLLALNAACKRLGGRIVEPTVHQQEGEPQIT